MDIQINNSLDTERSADDIFAALLQSRGHNTPMEVEEFLHPPAPTLAYVLAHSGITKQSLDKAKSLITQALKGKQDILVFGDYDADGVTAAAVMWTALTDMAKGSGARVLPFIPDRTRHGYGLSSAAIKDIADGNAFADTDYPDFHPSLVVTVDNGIVAVDAVQSLRNQGINVIITDHHQPDKTLPAASCILHTTITSGAGLAWIAALYWSSESPAVRALIDIATIGIVADMMPLSGVNRAIVTMGLKLLSRATHPGLASLYELSGIGKKEFTTYDINFGIAPRLNAAGRLADPVDALRLLCTSSPELAKKLAEKIESHNRARQLLTEKAVAGAMTESFSHNLIVLDSPEYHEGVIGLVASKLMEKFGRPAIVISVHGETAKGSARSVPGVNIIAFLRAHASLFTGLGGHEGAAGFSLRTADIPRIKSELTTASDTDISVSLLGKKRLVDMELGLRQVTLTLARLLSSLEPYGMGNMKPTFLLRNVNVLEDCKVGASGNHRKLVIEQGGVTKDVIWFNGDAPHPISSIKNLVGTIDINVWRERETVQVVASYVEV